MNIPPLRTSGTYTRGSSLLFGHFVTWLTLFADMALSNDQLSRKGTSGRPETPATTPGSSRRAGMLRDSLGIRDVSDKLTITGTPDTSATSIVNPSSSLLQDLLKEQRASRGSRGSTPVDGDSQVPPTPDKFRHRVRSQSHSQSQSQYQDDVASERQRKVNTALSAGLRQPREMGVREMDHVCCEKENSNLATWARNTNDRSMCQK